MSAPPSPNSDEGQGELLPESGVAPGDVLVSIDPQVDDPNEASGETLLPVSGMVRLTPRELEVIDHPAFQRLFEVYQLGQTHLVYRGATHMRGEHSIGTVSTAMQIIEAIGRNRDRKSLPVSERWQRGAGLSDAEIAFVRLAALLHDIGHLPAGHTLEDELGLLPHHDADQRINLLLDRTEWHGLTAEPLRELIDRNYPAEAAAAAQRDGSGEILSASGLLTLLISSEAALARSTPDAHFRVQVCRDVVGNTICADLIDYLHRDWLHLGKPRAFDPRLLDYMMILSRLNGEGIREDRLVIHLGVKGRPRPDAVTAILDLLESRYQLFEIALFHRVKLAAAGMLERVMAEYRDTFADEKEQNAALDELIPDLLETSDAEVVKLMERKLSERRARKNAKRVEGAISLARNLRVRRLHRDLLILYTDDLGGQERAAQIAERYSGDSSLTGTARQASIRRAAENRLRALRVLEGELKLGSGSIVMYCPPLQMSSKIAKVGIYGRGRVGSLVDLDHDQRISGGHLDAQERRFRRLWRILFAIEPETYARLERDQLLKPLQTLIREATLWDQDDLDDDPHTAVREVAETLVELETSPWFGHEVIEPAHNRGQEAFEYVGGAPSARSYISPEPGKS